MWRYKTLKNPLSAEARRYMKSCAYPLFDAVEDDNVAVFRELVEHDPKLVDTKNHLNIPILYEVFAARNLEMAKILFEYNANPEIVLTFFTPPRTLIVEAIAATHKGFVELLINKGASIDESLGEIPVRKILENPSQYVKLLFDGDASCDGARRFLAKAAEMKELVDRLRPPPVAKLSVSTSIERMGIRQRIPTEKPTTPPPAILAH